MVLTVLQALPGHMLPGISSYKSRPFLQHIFAYSGDKIWSKNALKIAPKNSIEKRKNHVDKTERGKYNNLCACERSYSAAIKQYRICSI